MKQTFYITLLHLGWLLSLASCGNTSEQEGFLPQETHTILTIHQADAFLNAIEQNSFWKTYAPKLPDAKTQALLATMGSGEVQLLYTPSEIYCLQAKNSANQNLWQPQREVKQVKVGNYLWNYNYYGQELIISTSGNLYNEINLFRTSDKQLRPNIPAKSSTGKAVATLSMNRNKSLSFFEKILSENYYYFFQGWSSWNITINQQKIQMVGASKHYKDSLSLFSLVSAKINHHDTFKNIPAEASLVQSYSFAGTKKWAQISQTSPKLAATIREVSFFELKGETFVVVAPASTDDFIRHFTVIDEQRLSKGELLSLEVNKDMEIFLNAFDNSFVPSHALVMADNVIFAENKKTLATLSDSFVGTQSLAKSPAYENLLDQVASKSPYWTVKQLPNPWELVAMQIIPQEEAFVYIFTAVESSPSNAASQKTKETTTHIAQGVAQTLQVVHNHRTNDKEIILQDAQNNLYLVALNGQILWKKPLEAPIVGRITQVDILKNNKLQYAFATEKAIHVIDRNGNNVSGFPIASTEKLLPLSVFDYDGKKDYRFVMTTPQHIYLYDSKGKKVSPFAGENPQNEVTKPPKHFRIKGKDYIVYTQATGTLKILHRNGNERLAINEKFNFSANQIYEKNAQFTFTTTQGKQYFINSEGKVSAQEKHLTSSHIFKIEHGKELLLNGNELNLSGQKWSLPSGYYSYAKAINIAGAWFVLAYNQEYERLYLFNQQGKTQQGFPLVCKGLADIAVQQNTLTIAYLKDNNTVVIKSISL